jgi:DNA-directed RNA polymerase specialized sigma24 family protein
MLIDAPQTRHCLRRLVTRLTPQTLWHEDLLQEALVHLWQQECRWPGRSARWYLRSCQFHLQNQLRHGRSIDSPKRRNRHVVPLGENADPQGLVDTRSDWTAGAEVFDDVVARDLTSTLRQWLTPVERRILACLLDGLGVRETGRRLKVSHTFVALKRRQIADIFRALDVGCLRKGPSPGPAQASR